LRKHDKAFFFSHKINNSLYRKWDFQKLFFSSSFCFWRIFENRL
jgi:hypothetical protein